MEEARSLHRLFKPKLLELIAFNTGPAEKEKKRRIKNGELMNKTGYEHYVEKLNLQLETLESALGKDAGDYSHFHVCIFEWDSGM